MFGVYCFIEPFISLWLGKEYILDRWILVLLMVNTFIIQTRGAVDMFNNAYGHYADVWAAWAEGSINLTVTLISAPFIGISGILLGKTISLFVFIVLWKPIYLFRKGFQISILSYWKNTFAYYIAIVLSMTICSLLKSAIQINEYSSFIHLIFKGSLCISSFILLYCFLLYIFAPGFKDLIHRFVKR